MDKTVLLDMDGVIANFVQGQIDSQGLDITHNEWASWDFYQTLGLTDDQMWAPTFVDGWWSNLKVYDWAKDLVKFLRQTHKIVYCTSPSVDHKCPGEKILWLRQNGFMSWTRNDYQIGPNKELNAKSGVILIDDSDANGIEYTAQGGNFILFPQPWNANGYISEHSMLSSMAYVKEQFNEMNNELV